MSATSFATTLSFHEYSGVIGLNVTDQDGNLIYEQFTTMNDTAFTADDIESSAILNSSSSTVSTVYRGTRTFDENTSTINFYTSQGWINSFSFQAAENSNYGFGEEFLLGSLAFTNGFWWTDPVPPSFTFSISASSKNVHDGEEQVFNGTIRLVGKVDDSDWTDEPDPVKEADWFYIQESPELGSVGVFEGETGSIEIWGKYGSLNLVEFRNPTEKTLTSDSLPYDSAPIPEPATVLLFGLGLLGVAGVSRRKN